MHNSSYVGYVFPIMRRKCRSANLTAPSTNVEMWCVWWDKSPLNILRDRVMTDGFFFPLEKSANSIQFFSRAHEISPIVWADLLTSTSTCKKSTQTIQERFKNVWDPWLPSSRTDSRMDEELWMLLARYILQFLKLGRLIQLLVDNYVADSVDWLIVIRSPNIHPSCDFIRTDNPFPNLCCPMHMISHNRLLWDYITNYEIHVVRGAKLRILAWYVVERKSRILKVGYARGNSIIRHVREIRNPLHLDVSSTRTVPCIRPLALMTPKWPFNTANWRDGDASRTRFDDVHLWVLIQQNSTFMLFILTVQKIDNGGGKHDSLGFVVTVNNTRCLRNGLSLGITSFLPLIGLLRHVN